MLPLDHAQIEHDLVKVMFDYYCSQVGRVSSNMKSGPKAPKRPFLALNITGMTMVTTTARHLVLHFSAF